MHKAKTEKQKKPKHIKNERMCLVCRKHMPKDEMLRIVKNKENKIFTDKSGKSDGRGAYICKSAECCDKMNKTRALNRCFKTQIDNLIYEEITLEIKK